MSMESLLPTPGRCQDEIDKYAHITCEIHGQRVVRDFPPGCPLAATNPLWALSDLTDAGESLDGQLTGNARSQALYVFDTRRVCGKCVDDNLNNVPVMNLRAQLIGEIDLHKQVEIVFDAIKRMPKHHG